MVIIRISGGIGNQLFQYAFGRALSLRTGSKLKLDTHVYDLNIEPDRSFKLPHFSISGIPDMIATPTDFKELGIPYPAKKDIVSKILRTLKRKLDSRKPLSQRVTILEPGFDFSPEIANLKDGHYFCGVWQSEKYFVDHTDAIRKDFALSAPFSSPAMSMSENIKSAGTGSISIHIRRGDQVQDPWLLKKHGDLGKKYYLAAVEYIAGKVTNPNLFVFSDDITWCKEHMKFDLPTTYVSSPNILDYEELILMSTCAHNIIAKSSFSWWAAWLNRNPEKIVVTPKQRFGDPSVKADDLTPDTWIKI
ncbi:MAG: hypothetical protein RLY66_555 [Candidatus Parcubacteria bacterium]|jgi:hypothetical protein